MPVYTSTTPVLLKVPSMTLTPVPAVLRKVPALLKLASEPAIVGEDRVVAHLEGRARQVVEHRALCGAEAAGAAPHRRSMVLDRACQPERATERDPAQRDRAALCRSSGRRSR